MNQAQHTTPNGDTIELGCAHVSPNHSENHITVSAGREPIWVCGYHATHFLFETLNGINVVNLDRPVTH